MKITINNLKINLITINNMNYSFLQLFILFIFLTSYNLSAQQGISISSGTAVGLEGSSDFSIGQCAYISNESASGSEYQGLQQPYEINVSKVNNNVNIEIECSVYPNPFPDIINLKIPIEEIDNTYYYLFDHTGRVLNKEKIIQPVTQINLSNFNGSVYSLVVKKEFKLLKTFNIIKN